MESNAHYFVWFSAFFLFLGIISPYMNSEFSQDLTSHDFSGFAEEDGAVSGFSIGAFHYMIFNIFTLPFWTFGLPAWINLSVLLILRLGYWFVIIDTFAPIISDLVSVIGGFFV